MHCLTLYDCSFMYRQRLKTSLGRLITSLGRFITSICRLKSWRELRFDQKWRSHTSTRDGAKEKRKEPAEEVGGEEDVRPPGVKASKAAKRKKHFNEPAFDQIESILEAKNNLSKHKLLDRLLGKNAETLSDQERALKNKLISEML